MQADELLFYLRENQSEIIRQIREEKCKPNLVRRGEIPKEERGKVRKILENGASIKRSSDK